MKRYEDYKNSGVLWIGEVPSHWEIVPFKYYTNVIMGQSPNGEDIKSEGETPFMQGNAEFGNLYPSTIYFCEACSKFSRIGDILMSVRAPVGEINLSDKVYGIGRGLCSISAKHCNRQYLWYFLKKSKNDLNIYANGSTFTAITIQVLKSFKLILPPLPEQQAIASFLDAKTKPIDGIIAKREKQIELLEEMKSAIISRAVTKGLNPEAKMKDSGIEWIGEIPEGWDVIKTSFLFQLIGSGTTPSKNAPNYAEEGLYWLQTGDFNDNYVNDTSKYITDLAVQNCSALTLFPKGCLVIAMYGASIGKLGILNIESYTNQACCVLGREKNILIKFAFYAYKAGRKALINESRGGGQPNISQDIISHFKIPVPPINEQCNVIAYLDSETSKIDTRITKRRKQIELLQEYKQALITAAVTGKIDVRELNS
ncbi:MAG: restriction endonuclease subunit S [Prevotella pectinovora]|uniref:restriction endonuclease subunit S n=1 Tax=Prevotella pectinovora TaxID=1602169 RepID=UPI002E7A00C4|nr:restriction endonuclease subunit S [Prevotella pectinovora]MEE1546869.1 restriction endonuclease subunit S [Prevotella pectinovora]